MIGPGPKWPLGFLTLEVYEVTHSFKFDGWYWKIGAKTEGPYPSRDAASHAAAEGAYELITEAQERARQLRERAKTVKKNGRQRRVGRPVGDCGK